MTLIVHSFLTIFFSSPNLIQTLFEKKNIYIIRTIWANRKNMPAFSPDKNLKRGDCEFKTCKNVVCVKWMDNRVVTLIGSNAGNLKGRQLYVAGKELLANQQCPVQSL